MSLSSNISIFLLFRGASPSLQTVITLNLFCLETKAKLLECWINLKRTRRRQKIKLTGKSRYLFKHPTCLEFTLKELFYLQVGLLTCELWTSFPFSIFFNSDFFAKECHNFRETLNRVSDYPLCCFYN